MYTAFYGLKEDPFSITPDPRFLYWSPTHQEAFRHLVYGIQGNKGLVALTGEPGTGKTAILHAMTEHLRSVYPQMHIAFLVNSKITVHDLFSLIFDEFHIDQHCDNKSAYLIAFRNFLIQSRLNNEKSVIILDEAQNFHAAVLEEIRLLSNIETASEKLLHILLVGQPKLLTSINASDLAQLKQRLGIIYKLSPLNRLETTLYIHKRLSIAGAPAVDVFTSDALDEIFAYSGGLPRLINVLCDNALLFGFAAKTPHINGEIIRRVAQDMDLNTLEERLVPESRLSIRPPAPAAEPPRLAALGTPLTPQPMGAQGVSSEMRDADRVILQNAAFSVEDWDELLRQDSVGRPRHSGRFLLLAVVLLGLLGGILGAKLGLLSLPEGISSAWKALTQQIMPHLDTSAALDKAQGHPVVPLKVPATQRGNAVAVIDVVPAMTAAWQPDQQPTAVTPGQSGSGEKPFTAKKVLVVRPGDTLSEILVREYGEYSKKVLELVTIANPGVSAQSPLAVGQRLVIPERLQ